MLILMLTCMRRIRQRIFLSSFVFGNYPVKIALNSLHWLCCSLQSCLRYQGIRNPWRLLTRLRFTLFPELLVNNLTPGNSIKGRYFKIEGWGPLKWGNTWDRGISTSFQVEYPIFDSGLHLGREEIMEGEMGKSSTMGMGMGEPGGSLPDLTSIHMPSPLTTPIDVDSDSQNPHGSQNYSHVCWLQFDCCMINISVGLLEFFIHLNI